MRRIASVVVVVLALAGMAFAQQHGGSMVVSFKDDLSTLDPAVGYDWQNWSIIKSVFDGLMDYEPGTTHLVPHLAQSYDVSDDGLTYTFHLRQGVTFHNGRTMTADDVVYSFQRMFDPATQSPGSGFFTGIEGAQAFMDGTADSVTGVTAPDANTVVFQLTAPDASFLQKVALNFAYVVPKEAVDQYGADFGHHPVGTGPFMLKEWVLGQRVVLERNPNYFLSDLPYLDEITFQVGLDPNVAFLRLQQGQVDILGDGIPSANFTDTMNDAALSKLVEPSDQIQTGYVTINTTIKPFDDVRVRQALNMAINKDRIVRIINNRAGVANQILPPLMPGYDPDFQGYPYDPEQAKQLLADAGYPDGFSTELYAYNVAPNDRIAQAIQQDLAAIGVKVDLKALAQSVVIETASAGEAPLVWSGGMAWIADYPDPNDFYWPILACASAVPGGWNWARYCNQDIEARAAAADAMPPDQADARIEAWKQIFDDIQQNDAPWIPIFNEKRYTMHTARLGGAAGIFTDPIHIPVNYPYVGVVQGQ